MSDKYKGVGALLLAATLYGSLGIFSRFIGFAIPIFYQQFVRFLLTLIILFIFLAKQRSWKNVQNKDWAWIILRGVGGLISFVGVYVAFLYLDFGTNYFVSYASATIGGYLLGKILCGEKINRIATISLFIALCGLYVVYSANVDLTKTPFIILSFIAGVGTAIWNVVSKKISNTYSNLQIVFLDTAFGAIVCLIISLFIREQWTLPSANYIWLALVLLTFVQIGTNIFVVFGFKRVEANLGSLILLFDIVAGLAFAALLYKEIPSTLTLVGGLLIVIAISLPSIWCSRLFRCFGRCDKFNESNGHRISS